MFNRIHSTICENCNTTVHSAPGFCRVCGHTFGAVVVVTASGTQQDATPASCPGLGPSMYTAVVWERVAIDSADRRKQRLLKRITA